MNTLIITQDDPFYLPECLSYLVNVFPSHSRIVGCIVLDVSPYGKPRESQWRKALRTLNTFGIGFFIRYSFMYIGILFGKPQVTEVMSKHGIPVIRLQDNINNAESLNLIRSFHPEVIISIAANQVFKKALIESATKGVINLHTALLPKYRGLMPTFWVLKNSEARTGVSVFFVDEGIDSGPILVQKEIEIGEMTQEQLIIATKRLGMDAIVEAIDKIQMGGYQLIPNRADEATYYSFPAREDVRAFLRAGKKFF